MTITSLSGGRGRLRSDAAASIARIDKARHGHPLHITSALRTDAQQRALIRRWNLGGVYNRPPYLYKPAMYPPFPHASGLVVDTTDVAWMLTWGRAHGWRRPFFYDKVHFQYHPTLDKKRPPKVGVFQVLKVGSHGDRVRQVRKALHLSPGGYFGLGTRTKVQAFQRAHGLTPDGRVGPVTWTALGLGA